MTDHADLINATVTHVIGAHVLGRLTLQELCKMRIALVAGALYDEVNDAIRHKLENVYSRSIDGWAARLVDVLVGVFDSMLASLVAGTWPVRQWCYMLTFGEHKVFFDANERQRGSHPLCNGVPGIFCAVYKDVENFNSYMWVERYHPQDVIGTFLVQEGDVGPNIRAQWSAMTHQYIRQALWAQLGGDAAMVAATATLAPLAAAHDVRGLVGTYRDMVRLPFNIGLEIGNQYLHANGKPADDGGRFIYTFEIGEGGEQEFHDPRLYQKVSCRSKHLWQWMVNSVIPTIGTAVQVAKDLARPFQQPMVC
jgi:hypothetical protein